MIGVAEYVGLNSVCLPFAGCLGRNFRNSLLGIVSPGTLLALAPESRRRSSFPHEAYCLGGVGPAHIMALTTKRKWIRWLLLGAGSLCVSASIPSLTPIMTWRRAVGTIEMSTASGERLPSPSVRFRQANGTLWGHRPSADELPRGYHAGDTVTVLYRWKDAAVLSPALWMRPGAVGILGVLLVVIGLFSPSRSPRLAGTDCQPLQTHAA